MSFAVYLGFSLDPVARRNLTPMDTAGLPVGAPHGHPGGVDPHDLSHQGARATVALALALALGLAPRLSTAQTAIQAAETPVRDVHLTMLGSPWWDVGYIALGAAGLSVGAFVMAPPPVNVAPLDGLGHRDVNATAATASDTVLVAGMIGAVGMAAMVEAWGAGSRGVQILRAPLILAESALMATAVVNLVKNAVGECRPRAWDDASATCVGTVPGMPVREDRVAFPSGHTAPLAAMAGASLGLLLFPSHGRPTFTSLTVVTAALGVANLILREVAGAHTWVDTSTGYVLGTGVGIGTALLHTRTEGPVHLGLIPGPTPGLQATGSF